MIDTKIEEANSATKEMELETTTITTEVQDIEKTKSTIREMELENELQALLQIENLNALRLKASESYSGIPPTSEIFDFRSKYVIMLIQIKTTNTAYFGDPVIFQLAIAYMDFVLWSKKANDAIKTSPALPMACLLIAMKFLGSDIMTPKTLAKNVKCTTRTAILWCEIKVLKVLEWNLNLITPSHFIHALGSTQALSNELDVLATCMTSWVAAPDFIFKPSLWAAILSNNSFLLEQFEANDIELARQTFYEALHSAK